MAKRERKDGPAQGRKKVKLAHPHANGASSPPPPTLPDTSSSTSTTNSFYVAAGSYERFLYGLECELRRGRTVQVKPIFHFPAHLSCIKTLAFSTPTPTGKVTLVSGGTDEAIKIWDVRSRKEVGSLAVHSGVVSRIIYASPKLLVTASADATLSLLETKDFAVLRTFKGHKARINDVAIHPRGRVALSVSTDRTLRMWDMLGNRNKAAGGGKEGSSSTKLGAEGDVVEWSNDGSCFVVICDNELRIYSTGMVRIHTINAKTRFHDVRFYDSPAGDEVLLVACEDGRIRVFPLSTKAAPEDESLTLVCCAELIGHTKRVKELRLLKVADDAGEETTLAITASTDGFIRFYDLSLLQITASTGPPQQLESIAAYDTKGSRLVCLAAVSAPSSSPTNVVAENGDADTDQDSSSNSSDAAAIRHEAGGGEDEGVEDDEEEFAGFGSE